MGKKIFKEEQAFRSVDIVLFILFFMLLVLGKLVREVSLHNGSNIEGIISMLLLCLGVGCIWMLYRLKMKVAVLEDGIKFKMTPWHTATQKIYWKDVETCAIITTSTFAQWHGGNISFGRQKIFSLSGRNGLHLVKKDGTEYFIGSRKLVELEEAVGFAFTAAKAKPSYQQVTERYVPQSASILLRPI